MTKDRALTANEDAGHWLHTKKDQLMTMIPNAKVAERLMTIMIREVGANPDLATCTRDSILNAAIETAKLGLEIGGTLAQCHLVPHSTKKGKLATLIIGYRGLIALMKRGNSDIRDIFPVLVREGDRYSRDEYTSRISHTFDEFDAEREDREIIGAYCRVVYKDGHTWDHSMTRRALEKRRKVAKTQMIWNQWTEEMYMKTVIRTAAKYVDLAAEVKEMISDSDVREVDLYRNDVIESKVITGVEATKAAIKAPEVDGGSPLD